MSDKAKVTNQIVAYMKERIVTGAWPLGSKLPSEKELCNEFNCSRVSVRSALQRFIAIGAVESIHGKGSYLRSNDLEALDQPAEPISFSRLMDLLDFAALIWPHVCVQAAQTNRPELFQTLSDAVNRMRTLTPNQSGALAQQVDSFHRSIALSLENQTLLSTFSIILARISRYPCTDNTTTLYYGTVYYHDLLLSAMLRRDPEQIRAVVQDYFSHVKLDFYHPLPPKS